MARAYRAKKHFGQNFLQDANIIQRIATAITPAQQQCIIEIGPGLGALTKALLPYLDKLNVIEIDRHIVPELIATCGAPEKLNVINDDVLDVDFNQFSTPMRIVGNLPYNISTPILFHLLSFSSAIQDMHFMLQKEVVDRIVAGPNNKIYGRLSVVLQYFCDVTKILDVPPTAFWPKPKVDSAVVRLVPRNERTLTSAQETQFVELVKQAFSQRRKTIRNTLKDFVSAEQFEAAGIDAGLRAEALSVEDFVRLVRAIL